MFTLFLDRRTWDAAIGAEYATIAGFWFYQAMTAFAFVKPLTGVSGHLFGFAITTHRAGQYGFQNDVIHCIAPLIKLAG
jgi:hypothetical protein